MSDFLDLCERIRQHCQARHWHGSDGEQSWTYARSVTFYDIDGTPHPWDPAPLETGFKQPPATNTMIGQAESTLGYELPLALKQAYLCVANGGFGPGYGLVGVESLHRAPSGAWRMSDRAATYLEAHPRRFLECDDLSEGLAQLCDWGCGLASYLDLRTGRIYGAGWGERSDWNGVSPDASEFVVWMDFQATSIEDWFERWMSGDLDQPLFNLEAFEHYRE